MKTRERKISGERICSRCQRGLLDYGAHLCILNLIALLRLLCYNSRWRLNVRGSDLCCLAILVEMVIIIIISVIHAQHHLKLME